MKKTIAFAVLTFILLSNANVFACGMKKHSDGSEDSEQVSEESAGS